MQFIKLSDLFSNIKIWWTPSRAKQEYFWGWLPWVSIRDLWKTNFITETKETLSNLGVRDSNVKLIKKGSLLFSFKLSVWKVAFAWVDLYTNEAIASFEPGNPKVDLHYLYYCLPIYAKKNARTNNYWAPLLNKEIVKDLQIPLPSLEVQKSIVAKLDKLTELIDLKKEAIGKTEELTKSVFLEMFGDPIKNYKEWQIEKLGKYWLLQRGKSQHRPRNAEFLFWWPYPFIQTGDVATGAGFYIKNFSQTLSEDWVKQSRLFKKGTVCITIAANIWDAKILTFDSYFPDSVVWMGSQYPEFVACLLTFYKDKLDQRATKTAQKNINLEVLNDLDVIFPGFELQKKFSEIVQKNQIVIEDQKQSLQKIQELYDTMVQEVFSFSQEPILSVLKNNPKQIKIFIKSYDQEWFFWKIQVLPEWWICFYPPEEIEIFFFWNGTVYPWSKDKDHITFHNSGRVHIWKDGVVFDYWKFKEDENKIGPSKRESLWNHFPQLLFKVRVLDIQSLPKKDDTHTRRDGDIVLEQDNNSLYFTCGIFDGKSVLDAINWANDPFWLRLIGTYGNTYMCGLWEFEDCSSQEKDGTKILYLVARDYQSSDFEDQIKNYWYLVSVSEFSEIWSIPY